MAIDLRERTQPTVEVKREETGPCCGLNCIYFRPGRDILGMVREYPEIPFNSDLFKQGLKDLKAVRSQRKLMLKALSFPEGEVPYEESNLGQCMKGFGRYKRVESIKPVTKGNPCSRFLDERGEKPAFKAQRAS